MRFIKIQQGVYNISQMRFVFRKSLWDLYKDLLIKDIYNSYFNQTRYVKHGQESNRIT